MAAIKDLLACILQKYPASKLGDLSNARITKIIYLIDWLGCLRLGRQVTQTKWRYDNHGPFVWDIKDCAELNSELFTVESVHNAFGAKKTVIKLRDSSFSPDITAAEQDLVERIIEISSPLTWADFISLVYGTHPVASSERYTILNLIEKAKEYKAIKGIG